MNSKKITLNELKQLVKKVLSESENQQDVIIKKIDGQTYEVTYHLVGMFDDMQKGTIKGKLYIDNTGLEFQPHDFGSEKAEEIYYNDEENIQEKIYEAFDEQMGLERYEDKYSASDDLPDWSDENDDDDLVSYDVPDWAMTSLINGDDSGLEEEEIKKIDNFVNQVVQDHGNANFMLGDVDGDDNLGFCYRNDIDNLGSDCYRVYIRPDK